MLNPPGCCAPSFKTLDLLDKSQFHLSSSSFYELACSKYRGAGSTTRLVRFLFTKDARKHIDIFGRRNERAPVAIIMGTDPFIGHCSVMNLPYGVDELAVAGGLHRAPVHCFALPGSCIRTRIHRRAWLCTNPYFRAVDDNTCLASGAHRPIGSVDADHAGTEHNQIEVGFNWGRKFQMRSIEHGSSARLREASRAPSVTSLSFTTDPVACSFGEPACRPLSVVTLAGPGT